MLSLMNFCVVLIPSLLKIRKPSFHDIVIDGGEGYVGTVCEIGKSGTAGSPDKTVVIQWDNGTRTNYRVGYMGKYDLRVIDNAQIGKNCHLYYDPLCKFEYLNTIYIYRSLEV